jgi:hypothetical protein
MHHPITLEDLFNIFYIDKFDTKFIPFTIFKENSISGNYFYILRFSPGPGIPWSATYHYLKIDIGPNGQSFAGNRYTQRCLGVYVRQT